MKTMTCRQLGGACDKEFHANTFEEMAKLSKTHGMEMYKLGDSDHLKAMQQMQGRTPESVNEWVEGKRREFEGLPNDK